MTYKQSYTVFAQFYDSIMSTVPYTDWLEYLEMILFKINYHPQKILDLACGTGNMSFLLAKEGYQIIGIDGSEQMIQMARQKALRYNLNIPFFQGDFRSFSLHEPVDLVICLYDSLNYLLNEADLAKTFNQVYKALKPGGYFIFDLNTIKRLREIQDEKKMFEGKGYHCFWRDEVDPVIPVWKVYLTFFIEQEDGNLFREDEVHTERGYPLAIVRDLLTFADFEVEKVYDAFSFYPGSEESERVYFVVRKKQL